MNRSKKPKEWIEFHPRGLVEMTQRVEADGTGIKIHPMRRTRVLGVTQIRHQAQVLMEAADFAEKRGCPAVLME